MLLLLSGCGHTETPAPGDGTLTVKAIADGSEAHPAWTPDEAIAIFDGTAPVRFTVSGYGGSSSEFSGKLSAKPETLTALFPWSEEASFDGETVRTVLPEEQRADLGTPDAGVALAVASSAYAGTLLFKAAYGFISIPVKASDRISRITLTGLSGEGLSGACSISVSAAPQVMAENGGSLSIVPAEGSIFATGSFLAVVPPVKFTEGLRITLQSADGRQGAVDLKVPFEVRRTQTYSISADIFDELIWRQGGLSVNDSEIDPANNLYGLISDSSTGRGIPGVPVTDGFKFVTTDANGVYQMRSSEGARRVCYTLPSGYSVELDPASHRPLFYGEEDIKPGNTNRFDFSLQPAGYDQNSFTLLMMGDPQIQNSAQLRRFNSETIPDVIATLNEQQAEGRYGNVCGVVLGDMAYDNSTLWPQLKEATGGIRLASGEYLPLYQTMGNHDKDSASEDDPDGLFIDTFGPTNYSLNIGKMHLVVMDNVRTTTREAHSYPNGYKWNYKGGFTDAQLEWLRQDLALVENPSGKLLIFCAHIPIRNTAMEAALLPLLSEFGEAHIMSAHTHYPINMIHSGGIYEHTHGAACGAFWHSNLNGDGQPQGYSLYEIEGASVKNWVAKGTGCELSHQMRIYDGNDTYHGSYTYRWYEVSFMGSSASVYVKGNSHLQNSFVASVWNDDTANWTVEFWQNGRKVGNFTRLAPGEACDVCSTSFFSNILGYKSNYYNVSAPGHIWYYTPASKDPSSETDWEVVAIQTIPSSGEKNIYRVNTLQKDYTGFAAK